jgi:hypothetical protein
MTKKLNYTCQFTGPLCDGDAKKRYPSDETWRLLLRSVLEDIDAHDGIIRSEEEMNQQLDYLMNGDNNEI